MVFSTFLGNLDRFSNEILSRGGETNVTTGNISKLN